MGSRGELGESRRGVGLRRLAGGVCEAAVPTLTSGPIQLETQLDTQLEKEGLVGGYGSRVRRVVSGEHNGWRATLEVDGPAHVNAKATFSPTAPQTSRTPAGDSCRGDCLHSGNETTAAQGIASSADLRTAPATGRTQIRQAIQSTGATEKMEAMDATDLSGVQYTQEEVHFQQGADNFSYQQCAYEFDEFGASNLPIVTCVPEYPYHIQTIAPEAQCLEVAQPACYQVLMSEPVAPSALAISVPVSMPMEMSMSTSVAMLPATTAVPVVVAPIPMSMTMQGPQMDYWGATNYEDLLRAVRDEIGVQGTKPVPKPAPGDNARPMKPRKVYDHFRLRLEDLRNFAAHMEGLFLRQAPLTDLRRQLAETLLIVFQTMDTVLRRPECFALDADLSQDVQRVLFAHVQSLIKGDCSHLGLSHLDLEYTSKDGEETKLSAISRSLSQLESFRLWQRTTPTNALPPYLRDANLFDLGTAAYRQTQQVASELAEKLKADANGDDKSYELTKELRDIIYTSQKVTRARKSLIPNLAPRENIAKEPRKSSALATAEKDDDSEGNDNDTEIEGADTRSGVCICSTNISRCDCVAMKRDLWEECEKWLVAERRRTHVLQSETARLLSILEAFKLVLSRWRANASEATPAISGIPRVVAHHFASEVCEPLNDIYKGLSQLDVLNLPLVPLVAAQRPADGPWPRTQRVSPDSEMEEANASEESSPHLDWKQLVAAARLLEAFSMEPAKGQNSDPVTTARLGAAVGPLIPLQEARHTLTSVRPLPTRVVRRVLDWLAAGRAVSLVTDTAKRVLLPRVVAT